MQRVLRFEEAYKAESIIDNMALQKGVLKDYLEKRRTAAFESYINFNLCSFDFYDVDSTLVDTARVLLYLDREDLIIFCEDERTCQSMKKLLPEQEADKEMALRGFFTALLETIWILSTAGRIPLPRLRIRLLQGIRRIILERS